jgi:Cd2+/Zn2+-exporting ATPase
MIVAIDSHIKRNYNIAPNAAWQQGILILGGATAMKNLKNVNSVIMDKTGTLTEGVLSVKDCIINGTWARDWKRFCLLVCAAEEPGTAIHPAARAIFQQYLSEVADEWPSFKQSATVTCTEEIPGQGIRCSVELGDGSTYNICLGNKEIMREYDICWEDASILVESISIGYIAIGGS